MGTRERLGGASQVWLNVLVLNLLMPDGRLCATMSVAEAPQSSNLPKPSYKGVFTAYVSRTIDTPIEKVWDVLADFPKYPEWYV